ncbi:MAG: hypothetical protein JXD23_05845 [Spirochaetales bacterium]|nr:hypothetical protein [Spirochaetales bacterium]
MEQPRKRSVFITVVSIIAIATAGFMILWSALAGLMTHGLMSQARAGGRSAGEVFDLFKIFIPVAAAAGVAFLVSAIGMLMRKNAFRIAFVTLLGLAGAGMIVLFFDSILRFGLLPHSKDTFFTGDSFMFTIMNVVMYGIGIGAIVVLIVFIMSKRASADFRKPEPPVEAADNVEKR